MDVPRFTLVAQWKSVRQGNVPSRRIVERMDPGFVIGIQVNGLVHGWKVVMVWRIIYVRLVVDDMIALGLLVMVVGLVSL